MKYIILINLLLSVIFAREDIEFVGGQAGNFGILNIHHGKTAHLEFDYDSTYTDNDSILVNNNNFITISYVIKAEEGETVTLAHDSTMSITNDIDTIQITDLENDHGNSYVVPSGGEVTVKIKGRINLPDNVSFGDYHGSLTITADYQD